MLIKFGFRYWLACLSFSTSVRFLCKDEKLLSFPLILVLVVFSSFSSLMPSKSGSNFLMPSFWRFFILPLLIEKLSSKELVLSESHHSLSFRLLNHIINSFIKQGNECNEGSVKTQIFRINNIIFLLAKSRFLLYFF